MFRLKFESEIFECVLIKVDEVIRLFKIGNSNGLDLDDDERQDMEEVIDFQQIPIPKGCHSIKAITLQDFVLVLLIDDSVIIAIDTLGSWEKELIKVNLDQGT